MTVEMSLLTMVSSCRVCSPVGPLAASSESINSITCKWSH